VGFSLLVFLVGLPILVGMVLLSDRILVFERWLATRLLGVDVPPDRETDNQEVWDYISIAAGRPGDVGGPGLPGVEVRPWAVHVHPDGVHRLRPRQDLRLGLFTFILMTLLGTIAGSFVLAPLYYRQATIQISIPEPIHLTLSYAVQQWGGVEAVSPPCHDNLLAGDVAL